MKIAFLGNQARAMLNFWAVFLRRLLRAGHEVICLVPHPGPSDDPAWEQALSSLGIRLVHYPLDRKGLNPGHDISTFRALLSILHHERPDQLFAYTIKPVIYGALAAALAGSPVRERCTLMITGLGYTFEADSFAKRFLRRIACMLYRVAFHCSGRVYFQNRDDKDAFEKLSIIPQSLPVNLCKGTGVDIEHFAPAPPPEGAPVFLYVGRLLEAKGLRELAEAARLLKAECPDARVQLLGPEEPGLGSIPLQEVVSWVNEGIVEYLGEARDVRPYLAAASGVVLPSWREGTPVSLLEAMSTGRAIIAADAPGSREVVRPGQNGFLVPLRDPKSLAGCMLTLARDPALARRMGEAGRRLVETEFNAERVAESLMREMNIPDAAS